MTDYGGVAPDQCPVSALSDTFRLSNEQLEALLQNRERHVEMTRNSARVFSERFDAGVIFPDLAASLQQIAREAA